jgi:hypothetical protein
MARRFNVVIFLGFLYPDFAVQTVDSAMQRHPHVTDAHESLADLLLIGSILVVDRLTTKLNLDIQ